MGALKLMKPINESLNAGPYYMQVHSLNDGGRHSGHGLRLNDVAGFEKTL